MSKNGLTNMVNMAQVEIFQSTSKKIKFTYFSSSVKHSHLFSPGSSMVDTACSLLEVEKEILLGLLNGVDAVIDNNRK